MIDEALVRFARALRRAGLPVGTGAVADFVRAAAIAEDAYWAGRATLARGPAEIAVYDRVFAEFFGGARPARPRTTPAAVAARVRTAATAAGEEEADRGAARASPVELLRRRRFAELSDEELRRLAEVAVRARATAPLRRSRRRRRSRRGELDLRRTLRLSLRSGGEPFVRARRERARRRRRVVLLLDVSGSMSEQARGLVALGHAALRADRRWEVFCFATRLTRITDELRAGDPDEALRRAAEAVFDWDGGTRIGESLRRFLDEHGHGGMARGAVVVVCSDGFEVGDPALLAEQAARLRRLAHRVVWLNPLAGEPGYEPAAAGMRAALPFVDALAAGLDLASLEALELF